MALHCTPSAAVYGEAASLVPDTDRGNPDKDSLQVRCRVQTQPRVRCHHVV